MISTMHSSPRDVLSVILTEGMSNQKQFEYPMSFNGEKVNDRGFDLDFYIEGYDYMYPLVFKWFKTRIGENPITNLFTSFNYYRALTVYDVAPGFEVQGATEYKGSRKVKRNDKKKKEMTLVEFSSICDEFSSDVQLIQPQRVTRSMTRKRELNKRKRAMARQKDRSAKLEDFSTYADDISGDTYVRGQRIARDIDSYFEGKNFVAHGLADDLKYVTSKIVSNKVHQIIGKSVDKIEGVILLIIALKTSTNFANAMAILGLYTKTHFNFSLTHQLQDICREFLLGGMTVQAGSSIFETICESINNAILDWKCFKKSSTFKHFVQLLCVVVSVGFVPSFISANGNFSLAGLNFLKKKIKHITSDAPSFCEALVESVMFFVTRGYQVFLTGNISDLFYDDADIAQVDITYSKLVAAESLLCSGKLHLLGEQGIEGVTSEAEFNKLLFDLIDRFESLIKCTDDASLRNVYTSKMTKLRQMSYALRNAQTNLKFKKKPYTLMICGPSSVGKSILNSMLITTVLGANGYPIEDEYRCVVNETDKYDTEIKPYTMSMTLDDWANLRPEVTEDPPTRRIIEGANNVARTTVQAELSAKGAIMNNTVMLTVTTNVMDLHCRVYSSEPASVARRFNEIVEVSLKPSHRNALGGLDDVAYDKDPSAWLFTVYHVQIVKRPQTGAFRAPDDFKYVKVWEQIDVYELCDYIRNRSIQHFKQQTKLVDVYHNQINKICPHCSYVKAICVCDREPELSDTSPQEEQCEDSLFEPYIEEQNEVVDEVDCNKDECDQLQDLIMNRAYDKQCRKCGYYGCDCNKKKRYNGAVINKMLQKKMVVQSWQCSILSTTNKKNICYVTYLYFKMIELCGNYWSWYKFLLCDVSVKYIQLTYAYTYYVMLTTGMTRVLARDKINSDYAVLRRNISYNYYSMFESQSIRGLLKQHYDKLLMATFGIAGVAAATLIARTATRVVSDYFAASHVQSIQSSSNVPNGFKYDGRTNVWMKPITVDTPVAPASVGITPLQLHHKIAKSLYFMRVVNPNDSNSGNICNAFPLKGNLWLVPRHMFYVVTQDYKIELAKTRNDIEIIPRFSCVLTPADRYYLPHQDLCVVQIRCAGDQPDLMSFIATHRKVRKDYCYNMTFLDVTKPTEWIVTGDVRTVTSECHNVVKSSTNEDAVDIMQYGCGYRCFVHTKPGMCMGVLYTSTNSSEIVGFHSAGCEGSHDGFFVTLISKELEGACKYFITKGFVVHSSGTLDVKQYDIDLEIESYIHPKNPIHYMPYSPDEDNQVRPSAEIYGSHGIGRARPYTSVQRTFISEQVQLINSLQCNHTIPDNRNLKHHWHKDLNLRLRGEVCVPPHILELSIKDLHKHIKDVVRPLDMTNVKVLFHDAVLAGIDGVYGIDSLNLSTSLGFPLNKPKKTILKESMRVVKGITRPLDIPDKIMDDINDREDIYRRGLRNYPIFRTTLKDEPVKINKDKRRLFEAAPFWYVYLMRKYTLSVSAFIMRHRLSFNTAVGANVHSTDWQDIYNYLHRFNSGKYIAGDYKAFDKNMPSEVLMAAFSCVLLIARLSGNYSEQDLYIMQGIQTDLIYPLLEFDTLMIKVFNSHCSGNSLTVILNNFANLLYIRCAYYSMYNAMPPRPFAQSVNIIVYGDDNVAEVHSDEQFFNHTTCSQELRKFGIEYTMADKEAESVPFISIEEVDFLKRRFQYCDGLGLVVAPLALSSIAKGLHFQVLSKGCDMGPRHLIADILRNAFDEIWCHGCAVYDDVALQLYDVVLYHGLQNLVGPYHDYQQHLNAMRRRFCLDQDCNGELDSPHYEIQSLKESSRGGLSTDIVDRPSDTLFILKHIEKRTGHTSSFKYNPTNMRCQCNTKSIMHSYLTTRELEGTLLSMNNMICQSSREIVEDNNERMDAQVLTTDNAEPGFASQVNAMMEGTQYTISPDVTSIANFLSRPVRINRYTFPVGTPTSITISPWEAFLQNPAVATKTDHYAFIRGRLHVHFEITGSPFRYGKFMASYLPCTGTGDQGTDFSRVYNTLIGSSFGKLINSQRMKIFLNPTNGQGGDLILPFMYPYDYLSLRRPAEWFRMGTISLDTLVPPQAVNSSDQTVVTITVYAHMENVELVGPTTMFAQSAYEKGPLSRPASVVANVASNLTNIPTIGPYMRVTQAAASSLASIAALLGFSRPVSLKPETRMIPRIVTNLANCDAEDNAYKLSVDSKQEITIDPRTVDLGSKDEMAILNIVQIESWLCEFGWLTTNLVGEQLFNIAVSPCTYRVDTDVEPIPPIWMTPCCVVSQAFRNWRGGMKYRFIANSSSLFRGKLKITYEPGPVNTIGDNTENTNYTYIMDLAHTDDFTVCVHWCSNKHYLNTNLAFLVNSVFLPGIDVAFNPTRHNGKLYVSVLNELTSPGNVVADCRISVFVSMCDDADFARPTGNLLSSYAFSAQSGDSLSINLKTNMPTSTAIVTEFGSKIIDPEQNNVYFGEKISSIRTLMKRYVHTFTESDFNTDNTPRRQLWACTKWRLIAYRGYYDKAVGLSAAGRYSYSNITFLQWFRLAYLGERGSTRLKLFRNVVSNNAVHSGLMAVTRVEDGDQDSSIERENTFGFQGGDPSLVSRNFAEYFRNSGQGMAITDVRINPTLEIEFPDYTGVRYSPTTRTDPTTDNQHNFRVVAERTTFNASFTDTISYFLAAGEDYTLFYWAGLPPVYILSDPVSTAGNPYPVPA